MRINFWFAQNNHEVFILAMVECNFLFIKILETMISELRILDLVFFVESVNKAMSGDAFLM